MLPVGSLAGGPAKEQCRHAQTVYLGEHHGADTSQTGHLKETSFCYTQNTEFSFKNQPMKPLIQNEHRIAAELSSFWYILLIHYACF